MKSATLKDEQLEAKLNNDGYLVINDFLTAEEVAAARAVYAKYKKNEIYNKGMWHSLYDTLGDDATAVSNALRDIVLPGIDRYFSNYNLPVYTIMSKLPNDYSNCEIHRDYGLLDENEFEYRNLWIPLVDINEQNGALYVLGKSHRMFNYTLPFMMEWPYKMHSGFLMQKSKTVYCKAGSLVIYKDRTLHGSFRNNSGSDRPVVHMGILHKEAEVLFYKIDERTKMVNVYKVSYEFYLTGRFNDFDKTKYPLHHSFRFTPPKISTADLSRFFN